MNKKLTKGFTLLELLIVIAILAILATAVVLVLNPAEYLRQARDTQRMNDLTSLKGALDLYIANTTSTTATSTTAGPRCTATSGTGATSTAFSQACAVNSTSTAINGSGWIDINFSSIPNGSPIAKLPIDPSNANNQNFYQYAMDGSAMKYRLATKLESTKYSSMAANDGGQNANFYEIGTDMSTNAAPF